MKRTGTLLAAMTVARMASAATPVDPLNAKMLTEWGEKVTAENAWREYPRPQMVRENWQNLNGKWRFGVGTWNQDFLPKTDREILVPFCVESPLSGVGLLVETNDVMVYEREFLCPLKEGERAILHFESVDYRAQVFVNGREATDYPHEGYSVPFELDVTKFLKPGANALKVVAWDPTTAGDQAVGKQIRINQQCFYTRCSGIMGTVWLEVVPETHVVSYQVVADPDAATAEVKVTAAGDLFGAKIAVRALDGEKTVAEGVMKKLGESVRLALPKPVKAWSPESPFLYGLEIEVTDVAAKTKDVVRGYFGARKLERKQDAKGRVSLFLNGKRIYLLATLDQGWWPDGFLTPPSEAAMRYDVEVLKKAGFNTIRKHIKVEPRRFYYDCDRLGMMLIQDMPCGAAIGDWCKDPWVEPADNFRQTRYAEYRRELKEMVEHLYNSPAIVMWAPYNESWGQPTMSFCEMTYNWLREADPTRFLDGPSGWWDWWKGGSWIGLQQHEEDKTPVAPTDTYDVHGYGDEPQFKFYPDAPRAPFLGEFGGYSFVVTNHFWRSKEKFEYHTFPSREALFESYAKSLEGLKKLAREGLVGSVYTQTTDVEIEFNGIMTYDRKVIKFDLEKMKKLHDAIYAAAEEGSR